MKQKQKTQGKGEQSKYLTNEPKWYKRGLASKLMSTNLTWSGVKSYNTKYSFISTVGIPVNLVIPLSDYKLHNQIRANINILWQALRGKNTGAFNYTEEDVYNYMIGLYAMIVETRYLHKILSLVNKYDPEVDNLPEALLAAIFSPTNAAARRSEIVTNKPSFCERLNTIAKDLNTYALHGSSLLSRWNYIAEKCIADFNGPHAVYNLYYIKSIPELRNPGGVKQNFTIGNESTTVHQLIANIEACITEFRTYNNGVNLKIAGDMIKLLGATSSTFNNVPYINGAEVPIFNYDPEAKDQLRNAKGVVINEANFVVPSYDWSINGKYSTSIGLYNTSGNVTSLANSDYLADEWLVTTDRNKEFLGEENIQMVQFYCTLVPSATGSNYAWDIDVEECSPTLLSSERIIFYSGVGTLSQLVLQPCMSNNGYLAINGSLSPINFADLDLVVQNDLAYGICLFTDTATLITPVGRLLDVDNYAFMSKLQFRQLNNVAVYSLTYFFNPEDLKIMGILEK